MTAAYPTAIKSFFYRQDYIQIVEAADVNTAYDEITAIQNTLGTLPQSDTIDNKVYTWPSVKASISAVRKKVSDPYCQVSAHNFVVPYVDNDNYNPVWTSVTLDTHGMYKGGTQLVCPRSGVYRFEVYARWHLDQFPGPSTQTPLNRSGQLAISVATSNVPSLLVGQNQYFPQGFKESIHMNSSITTPWVQGNAVVMRLTNTVLTSGMPCTAIMTATYVRDPKTTNNM